MRALAAVAMLASVGCSYAPKVSDQSPDADPDGPPGPCVAIEKTCGDATTLLSCTVIGEVPAEIECPWGCLESPVHCGGLNPAGGGASDVDLNAAGLGMLDDVTLAPDATIDGDGTGTITGASSDNFTHALRANDSIAVFRFRSLTIGGNVQLLGSKSIVLISDGPLTINGVIKAMGPCGPDGSAATPGPGGFGGSLTSQQPGLGPAGSAGGGGGDSSTAGGGGGGNGGLGGRGGNVIAANGGAALGADTIPLLFGGGGGGAGGGAGGFGRGGGGGGAIQLISNTRIVFGTSSGIIAGGCGGDGDSGGGNDGGGGGGAGGTILLEAPEITGVAILAVNGGGGGSGGEGDGDTGAPGNPSRVPAVGQAGGTNAGDGGNGAAGGALDGSPGEDAAGDDAGGGGGGIGRIRFVTRTGQVGLGGEHSPALTDDPTTATRAIAPVD